MPHAKFVLDPLKIFVAGFGEQRTDIQLYISNDSSVECHDCLV